MNRLRAVKKELEQHPFLVAAITDLAHAKRTAVVIGEKRIVEATLRKEILLQPDCEEMREGAAAEAHDVGAENLLLPVVGCRLSQRFVLQCLDDGGGIEANVPFARSLEGCRNLVDGLSGVEIELRLDPESGDGSRHELGYLVCAERRLGSDRFDFAENRDIRLDGRIARQPFQFVARTAGDPGAPRGLIDVVDIYVAFGNEAVPHQFDDFPAREAVLAQTEECGHGAPETVRGQRGLLAVRKGEALRGGEAVEQGDVIRLERTGHDADVTGVGSRSQQCGHLAAGFAKLDGARVVLGDVPVGLLGCRVAGLLGVETADEWFCETVGITLGGGDVDRFEPAGRAQRFNEAALRAGHVVKAGHDLRRDGHATALDDRRRAAQ